MLDLISSQLHILQMKFSHQFYLAVRLGSLLNLNIRQSSYFQIRTSVSFDDPDEKWVSLTPVEIVSSRMQEEQEGGEPEILEDDSCTTPKLFIKHNSRTTEINSIFIFKGEVELPQREKYHHRLTIYCELIQYSGSEVDVVGEWQGRTHLHALNSHMEVYFSSHFLSCAVSASVHCILSDFIVPSSENKLPKSIVKSKNYYNYAKDDMTQLYEAAMDPLIQSKDLLTLWRNTFKQTHMLESEQNTNSELQKSAKRFSQQGQRFQSLNQSITLRKLSEDFLRSETIHLQVDQYLMHLKKDTHRLSEYLFLLWKDYLHLFKKYPMSKYYGDLRKDYEKGMDKDHWANRVQIYDQNGATVNQKDLQKLQMQEQEEEEEKSEQLQLFSFEEHKCKIRMSVQDMERLKKKIASKGHDQLMVLVHGYQATSFDMEMIAMYLRYRNPGLHILISNSNQGRTEGNIEDCGHRLAVQIKNFINLRELKDVSISFLGHSMGGIIIRACLPYLQLYRNNFHCYISLCTPHMGYLYHTSKIVTTSIWVMNQIKKDQSMIELTLNDNSDLTKTFLYELSDRKELSWFKSVIFVGSKEDEYVPFSSALVQGMEFFYESNSARAYQAIHRNIMQAVEPRLIRMEIVYKEKVKDLSTLIGRTGHIKVLSYIPIIDLYTHLFSKQL